MKLVGVHGPIEGLGHRSESAEAAWEARRAARELIGEKKKELYRNNGVKEKILRRIHGNPVSPMTPSTYDPLLPKNDHDEYKDLNTSNVSYTQGKEKMDAQREMKSLSKKMDDECMNHVIAQPLLPVTRKAIYDQTSWVMEDQSVSNLRIAPHSERVKQLQPVVVR